MVNRIIAIAIVATCAVADAQPADYTAAEREVVRSEAARAAEVNGWLASRNPFLRQAALLALAHHEVAMTASLVPSLLEQLGDDVARPLGACASTVAAASPQLPEQHPASWDCVRGERSNASLALELVELQASRQDATTCSAIVATIARTPQRGPALAPTSSHCAASGAIAALATTTDEAAKQALLRRALQSGQGLTDRDVPAVIAALGARSERTIELAALNLLATTAHRKLELPDLSAASGVIDRCLADDKCDVLPDLLAAGAGSARWGAVIVRRLDRPNANDALTALHVLATLPTLPNGARAQFERFLKMMPDTVLPDIAKLGADDRGALRSAVLAAATRDGTNLVDVIRALGAHTVTADELAVLDTAYAASCDQERSPKHDPNERWCDAANHTLSKIALAHGFHFVHD